jgi:hypothetical protein
MKKTLIIKELKHDIAFRVRVEAVGKTGVREIARFKKSGMGYAALGGAGRVIMSGLGYVDEVQFDGEQGTYERLLSLGVINRTVTA